MSVIIHVSVAGSRCVGAEACHDSRHTCTPIRCHHSVHESEIEVDILLHSDEVDTRPPDRGAPTSGYLL